MREDEVDNVEWELQGVLTKVAGMQRCSGSIEYLISVTNGQQ